MTTINAQTIINEVMQAHAVAEMVTCEAGESEASAPTAGQAAWSPVPQYVPPSLSQVKPGEPVPPAFRGGMDDIAPPVQRECGIGKPNHSQQINLICNRNHRKSISSASLSINLPAAWLLIRPM